VLRARKRLTFQKIFLPMSSHKRARGTDGLTSEKRLQPITKAAVSKEDKP
jgi:hypothetical protein